MHRVALALCLTLALGASVSAQSPRSQFGLDPDGPTVLPPEAFGFERVPRLPSPEPEPSEPREGLEVAPGSVTSDLGIRGGGPPRSSAQRREERLDRMFEQLASADDKERADRIARQILRRLHRSGSDTVDLLMERASVAMEAEDFGLALDLLDGVVRMKPDFAEGWNRRATVNFMAGDLGQSVADIEQTLRNEPRHWGALLGLSMILVAMERDAEALAMMDRALAVHPFLDELKERRERLERGLAAEL